MSSCSVSVQSRRAAPAVPRLLAALRQLERAAARSEPGVRELSGLVELVAAERAQLCDQIPAVVAFLGSVLRNGKASPATRRTAAESLAQVVGSARRLSETFTLYDTSAQRPDVLQPVLEALAWAVSQQHLQRPAVDALVGIARSISAGVREAGAPSTQGPWAAAWAAREQRRVEARESALAFNRDPEEWWRHRSADPSAAARAISEYGSALDRMKVGAFLSRHKDVLAAYVEMSDLKGMGIVPAFVHVLQGFCLPGEAQQIDSFCECFGHAWGRANSLDPEACYIFAFSLVMLSTDLHSTAGALGHTRMTFEQFTRNLHSAIPKGCLPERLIKDSYDKIQAGALRDWRSGGFGLAQESVRKACLRLRRAMLRQPWSNASEAAEADVATPTEAMGDLWRALWSAAWGPMLGAFSAAAHAAGQDEDLLEAALRGLQLGCEASALLGEAQQAVAFSTALQQLSP